MAQVVSAGGVVKVARVLNFKIVPGSGLILTVTDESDGRVTIKLRKN